MRATVQPSATRCGRTSSAGPASRASRTSRLRTDRRMSTRSELAGDILVVTLDNPPVNSLSLELRTSLLAALQSAEANEHVRAVVVIGANGMFCGGADLRVLNTP